MSQFPRQPEKMYLYDHDPKFFTKVLINSGYKLYLLTVPARFGGDEPMQVRVWAKPTLHVKRWKTKKLNYVSWEGVTQFDYPVIGYDLPDLSAIAEGTVTPLPLKGEEATDYDYILLDTQDGAEGDTTGVVVVGRTRTLPKKGGEDEFGEKAA